MIQPPPPGWRPQSAYADEMRQGMSPAVLKSTVTWADLIDMLGMVVEANKGLRSTVDSLHARIKDIEDRPSLRYLGIWKQEKIYAAGNFVTDAGSVWHAQRANVGERPATGDAWVLAVKKGRDAK